jgi:hypothetical protein
MENNFCLGNSKIVNLGTLLGYDKNGNNQKEKWMNGK